MIAARLLVAGMLAAVALPALAQAVAPKPVVLERLTFGGKPDVYGGGWGHVVGLKKKGGDGFLSVRVAPSAQAAEIDRLRLGHNLYVITPDADWAKAAFVAVIYTDDPTMGADVFERRCRVDNPPKPDAPVRKVYDGPCKSGWVARRFVEIYAG